ncbi:protein SIEVE ELEMENT OCCLUSION B-like isoform X1 [Camellia sinensis]|uniref:protein SIEVE ELEMENT OCCLUSION B-like isoform X1 n=2 Tax=Camellia sinensis TaxID=4442 RepID=UPI0010363D77|nr:protein SIEVE ELEMENT OCCLUSION B-like isoform X1 [Camellia sinensis]
MPVETSIVLLAYKCQIGMDGHQITISLFTVLSNYSWDAKLVLALAAYASNFGAFWLLAQMYTSNQLAKSMALLKRLPVTVEHSGPVKSRFDALNTLITAMLDLTRCIVALKDLPSSYVTQEVPALSAVIATIPTAVYWTVRGIVACATQITSLTSLTSLTSMGYEFITSATEAWELSSLAHKINSIHDHLKKQLELCYQLVEEKRNLEACESLVRLMEMIHLDNMKVLRALSYAKDDLLPLFDGSAKRRVRCNIGWL